MVAERREGSVGVRNRAKRLALASEGPWKAWKIRSRHGRAIKFIETYCRTPKGKGFGVPMKLARFQKEWLEDAFAKDIDAAILATPRGNGKSTFGGALAVWAVFDDDSTGSPQVPIIATTVGQAIRSCYGVAASMIRAEPELINRALIYTGISTPRVTVPANEGEMFPISNDEDGLQGLDPSFAVVDEIGFQPIGSWDALQLAQGKRERSLAIGLGTPGLDRENALWHLRQLVREGGQVRGLLVREYAAPEGCNLDDRKAWRKANPAIAAGFLRMDALENARARTLEGPFRAFRLGQWVEGVESWLGENGAALWESLTAPYDFRPDVPTWIGVDMALHRDTSAVVVIQQRPDGRYHAECKIWTPTAETPVDATDVMQFLRDLADRFSVQAISFDPRFFDVPAKMLGDEGLPMVEIPQSIERMTAAYGSAYDAIIRRQITHDGDQVFATQVLNAVARHSERGFMLAKAKSRGKIDAAVALSLAFDRALRAEPTSSIYETRGFIEI